MMDFFKLEMPVLWFNPEQIEKLEQNKLLGIEENNLDSEEELSKAFRKRQTFYIVESVTKAYDATTGNSYERFSLIYSGGKPFFIGWPYERTCREVDDIMREVVQSQNQ